MAINTGKVIGAALFAVAVAAIEFWPEAKVEAPADDAVRPVRSVVATKGTRLPDLYFTGKVKADSDRTLCFKQSGRIQRIPVSAGQQIKKGDRLAWLDPLDFESDLAKAEAAATRDRLSCERKREAAKKNAISKEEVSQAEAQLKQSEAQLALAKRALEDTVLTAPFDGMVAEAGVSRLRPVANASLTTVLGMLPLLTDAFYSAMAVTIMAGLAFATVLTMVVIPVNYALLYNVKRK